MFRDHPSGHEPFNLITATKHSGDRLTQSLARPWIMPEPIENLGHLVESLAINRAHDVTQFEGSPLLLNREGGTWLSPVRVEGENGEGESIFHIVYLNCSPETADLSSVPVTFYALPEIDIKLNNLDSPAVQEFRARMQTSSQEPQIIVRACVTTNLAYPEITTPVDLPPIADIEERAMRMAQTLGLNMDRHQVQQTLTQAEESLRFHPVEDATFDGFVFGQPRMIRTEKGRVQILPIYNPHDPWKYYEFISREIPAHSLAETQLRKHRQGKESLYFRPDSGCDNGQIYGDLGCDCHAQLEVALDVGAGVFHMPTQDGRGYGTVTKLKTEMYKQGLGEGVEEPLDTISAANMLFGNNFDIRTYDGVGRLLAVLDYKDLIILADNLQKLASLNGYGLRTRRVRTNILDILPLDHPARPHLIAKNGSSNYDLDFD